MKVKEAMNEVVAVDNDVSLKEAAKIMGSKDIGCLVLVRQKNILGIVTMKDIIKNITGLEKKISSVMPKEVVVVEKDNDLDQAILLMKKNKVKHLPVVQNEELVGIITATDLIRNCDDLDDDFFFD